MTAARRAFLGGILSTAALAGCREATCEQQPTAVSHAGAAAEARAREARWSETGDRELILQAGLGALQDLGFTIEESGAATGVLVGTKLKGARLPGGGRTAMRATFQRIQDRPRRDVLGRRVPDRPGHLPGLFRDGGPVRLPHRP